MNNNEFLNDTMFDLYCAITENDLANINDFANTLQNIKQHSNYSSYNDKPLNDVLCKLKMYAQTSNKKYLADIVVICKKNDWYYFHDSSN